MSVQILRDAAELLRVDHEPCACGDMDCPTAFFEAVALLLENEASAWESQDMRVSGDDDWPDLSVNHARRSLLTDVALAYLPASLRGTS